MLIWQTRSQFEPNTSRKVQYCVKFTLPTFSSNDNVSVVSVRSPENSYFASFAHFCVCVAFHFATFTFIETVSSEM